MAYMTMNEDVRLNPALLVPHAKSVISLAHNYYTHQTQNANTHLIAKYAYGKDYHVVLKEKLHELLSFIKDFDMSVNGRPFVDSAPILEKHWAVQAGLGWMGRNGLLIVKGQGSFVFLGELIVDIALEYDKPFEHNLCGTCTRCINACPNKAIVAPGNIDARKCISYLTIEHKGDVSTSLLKNSTYIFGCDICQDVCPWNRFAKPCKEPAFEPQPTLFDLDKEAFENLSEEQFNTTFKQSAVKRAGYAKLLQTIATITKE